MAKKRNNRTENNPQKGKKKKGTFLGITPKELAVTAALLAVLAVIILVSAFLPSVLASSKLGYFMNPWDDRLPFCALTRKNEIFAYSTAIEAIEETQGMDFSQEVCKYLAVDLSETEAGMRDALKEYFAYWGKKNGKEVLFATKEELKEQGLIADDGRDTFTDGYLLEFHENQWSEERDTLVVNYYFHHADFDGRGYTVTVYERWNGWEADEYIASLTS